MIALDIIEDFLNGEKFNYLRLVGGLKVGLRTELTLVQRMEAPKERKDKRGWMNSTSLGLMCSFTF